MIGYMMNFGVYTLAMAGLIAIALLVYKRTLNVGTSGRSSLKIDEKIALNARKSLYVVNAGGERFLIAGDMENTSLIAKLGTDTTSAFTTTTNNPINAVKPMNFADALKNQAQIQHKQFIGRETAKTKLPEFAPEVKAEFLPEERTFSKADFEAAKKSLDKAFGNVDPIIFNKTRKTNSTTGKRPVMKELARKLAEI